MAESQLSGTHGSIKWGSAFLCMELLSDLCFHTANCIFGKFIKILKDNSQSSLCFFSGILNIHLFNKSMSCQIRRQFIIQLIHCNLIPRRQRHQRRGAGGGFPGGSVPDLYGCGRRVHHGSPHRPQRQETGRDHIR